MELQSGGRVDPGSPQLLLRFSAITPIDSHGIGFGGVEGQIEESSASSCSMFFSKDSDGSDVTTARLGEEEVLRYRKQENRPAAAAVRRLL